MNRRRFLAFLVAAPVAVPAAMKAAAAAPFARGFVTPIPFETMGGVMQWDAAVIPLLAAKMDDAGRSISGWAESARPEDFAEYVEADAAPSSVGRIGYLNDVERSPQGVSGPQA